MPEPFAVQFYVRRGKPPAIEADPIGAVPRKYTGDTDDEEFCSTVRETIDEYRARIEAKHDPDDYDRDFAGEKIAYLGFHAPETVGAFAYCDDERETQLDAAVAQYAEFQTIDGIGLAERLGVSLVEFGALIERDPRFVCAGSPLSPWLDREGVTKYDEVAGAAGLSDAPIGMASKRVADAADAETDRRDDEHGLDTALTTELQRGAHSTREYALTGEIRGTGAWSAGEDIPLRVWVPFDDETSDERGELFVEDLSVPDPDRPLTDAKFGRLLDAHGYDRDSAEHLVGDPVECIYRGQWQVVDPDPPEDTPSTTPTENTNANAATNTDTSASTASPNSASRGFYDGRTRLGVVPVVLALGVGGLISLIADVGVLPDPIFPEMVRDIFTAAGVGPLVGGTLVVGVLAAVLVVNSSYS